MVHYPMGMYQQDMPFPSSGQYSDLAGFPKAPQGAAPTNQTPLDIPTVSQWLQYCDGHPVRNSPIRLSTLSEGLERKGFVRIDQLEGPGIDVEKIISWTDVPPGIALLLYRYAKEDMALIHSGQFSMDGPVASAP